MNDPAPASNPDDLEPIETASTDEIAALQLTRLRATLNHARANIAHYRARFDEAGVVPADLCSLEDLARFPFTVKEDLRRNYPFGMFAVPRERVMRLHASSGTTGTPTVVGYTRNDLDLWAGVMARSMRAAGVRSGEMGELVITSLTRKACPVIRFRTRDLTRLLPGTARSMRRMQKVTGRSDDMLIIRGVNLFPTQVQEILLRDDRLSPHYRLEVRRDGRLDELTVVVEARAGAADDATRDAAGRDIARGIKSRIGITSEVRVTEPESVERSVGKARRVVDLRPGD